MKREIILILLLYAVTAVCSGQPSIDGCAIFPTDNIWNTRIDSLPVDSNSAAYINTIGAGTGLHPDFGSGLWEGAPMGIPFIVVPGTQPPVNVTFDYDDESDPGPYPIPPGAPVEGGTNSDGDRHVLVLDKDNRKLYETWSSYCTNGDGSWHAGSGAIFDLASHALRPNDWTSADAAGLPVLPGLVRYEEVAAGSIEHAVRFTVVNTRRAYVWPARHYASSLTGPQYPPMGQRFRLKSGYDVSGFQPQARTILTALKKYGMILADNGSAWYISGAPDEEWDNDDLHALSQVKGSNFEAVACSSLMNDADSAEVRYPRPEITAMNIDAGAVQLAVTNLFPGVSNVIEHSFDLKSQSWQTNRGFLCDTPQTNWSAGVSNAWTNVFYRIKRL